MPRLLVRPAGTSGCTQYSKCVLPDVSMRSAAAKSEEAHAAGACALLPAKQSTQSQTAGAPLTVGVYTMGASSSRLSVST